MYFRLWVEILPSFYPFDCLAGLRGLFFEEAEILANLGKVVKLLAKLGRLFKMGLAIDRSLWLRWPGSSRLFGLVLFSRFSSRTLPAHMLILHGIVIIDV